MYFSDNLLIGITALHIDHLPWVALFRFVGLDVGVSIDVTRIQPDISPIIQVRPSCS